MTSNPSDMMSVHDQPAEPLIVEEGPPPVLAPWKRVIAVIMDPVGAMKGVRDAGGWVAPFVVLALSLVIMTLLAGEIMQEERVSQMQDRFDEMVVEGQLTQEQADQAMRMQTGGGAMAMTIGGGIIGIMLLNLILAALAMLVGNIILGGHQQFGTYWSLTWYVSVLASVGMILMAVLVYVTGDAQGGQLGLGLLTKSDPTTALHQTATTVTVFTVWEAVVAGIGLSLFTGKSRAVSMIWSFILFLVIPAAATYGLTSLAMSFAP